MKKKRFTEQQIIGFLKEAEAGIAVKDLCRKHGFSDAAFYGWRSKYGGLQVNEVKRLRELEARDAVPSGKDRARSRNERKELVCHRVLPTRWSVSGFGAAP